MTASDPLKDLLSTYGGSSGSSKTINNAEFSKLLKEFDENGDDKFSKSEFGDLADAWGIEEEDADNIYKNLTNDGQKDLTTQGVKDLAKDELQDGSLGLKDLGDLRSRLLGIGGAEDPSLPGNAGKANPDLNTQGIDVGKAVEGFNGLDKDDSNTVSSQEMKSGLGEADANGNGALSRTEFTTFAQDKLGLSADDAKAAYKMAKEDAGGKQPSIGGVMDLLGGDGSEQGLGNFLQSISDIRSDATR